MKDKTELYSIDNDLYCDGKVVYITSHNSILSTDLSEAQIKGYEYSHKEVIDGIDHFIYNKS